MRKVFLEDLPKYIYKNRECIDWKNALGYTFNFIYDDISGVIKIEDYDKSERILSLSYGKNKKYKISPHHLKEGKLRNLINGIAKQEKGKSIIHEVRKENGIKISERSKGVPKPKLNKKVMLVETGEVFPSASELIKQMKERLNISLRRNYIAMCCRKEKKQYKGYHFEYV